MAEQQQGIDVMVRRLLHVAKKRRWWLVVPTTLGALLACAATTVIPNTYTSDATILVAHQQVPERYVTPNDTSDLRETLLLVQDAILSRTQLSQIINDFDLYPKQRKRLAPEELVEVMRHDIVIAALEKTADEKELNSFKVSFTSTDPHVAQEVTSRLTNLFIQEDVTSRTEQNVETTEFLSSHLKAAADDLRQQESRVRDFKMRNLGQLPEQQEGNLGILTGLHTQLQNTESLLSHAREQQVYLETIIGQYHRLTTAGVSVAGAPAASPADAAKVELARLRNERADLLARYTEEYPDVVKVEEQIKEAEAQLAAAEKSAQRATDEAAKAKPGSVDTSTGDVTLAQYKSELKANGTEIANATADEKQLQAEIADYQSRLNMTPVREQQLADMLRDYDLSKKNYDDLMSKKTQSELATSMTEHQQGAQFKVIDLPSLPMKPSSPAHVKVALGGLAVGLALGAGIVFLLETIDHSLLDEQDLARYFSFPLLVGLPALPTPNEIKKRSYIHMIEWALVSMLCLLVCVTEFYIYRRG